MWHCPHCGAPQAETARCWVCRKSSTTCSTCRHFRASLATEVGYCALDRRRRPLTGRELRGCWTERPAAADAAPGSEPAAGPGAGRRGRAPGTGDAWERLRAPARDFVPVEDVVRAGLPDASVTEAAPAGEVAPAPAFLLAEPNDSWESRPSLFGDLDR
jgi:hypothetical protein